MDGMNLLTEARPLTDVATECLEAEISSVAATIAAVTCRWLAMIAEYDRRKAWEGWECRSMTHWLVGHVGLASSTAREHVRVAKALTVLPLLAAEFGSGRLSYSRVRTVTRVATPANEAKLDDFARACTAPQLERWVTAIERAKMADDPAAAQRIFDVRSVTFAYEDHGVWVARLRLPPEVGALLANLIAAEVAARLDESNDGSDDERLSIEQRRADALAVIIERVATSTCGLDGGDLGAHSGDLIDEALKAASETSSKLGLDLETITGDEFDLDTDERPEEPDLEVLDLDVLDSLDSEWAFGPEPKAAQVHGKWMEEPAMTKSSVRVATTASVTNGCRQTNETVGLRSGRFTPKTRPGDGVIHTRRDPLVVVHRYPDGAELNRRPLPVTTADRLACECITVSLDHDIEGIPLNFGRTRRSPNAAQRRAAAERDQCCRFPGCGSRKGLRLHHVKYWGRDKGRTDLVNLVYLCGKHHRAVHDLHWRIVGTPDGQIDFIRPDRDGPMRPQPPIDLDELVAGFRGPLGPIRSTAGAGDKLDLEMAVWGYFANEHLVQRRLIQQQQAQESASAEALGSPTLIPANGHSANWLAEVPRVGPRPDALAILRVVRSQEIEPATRRSATAPTPATIEAKSRSGGALSRHAEPGSAKRLGDSTHVVEDAAKPVRRPIFGWPILTRTETNWSTCCSAVAPTGRSACNSVISPRTVETHLAHVFDKLGIRTRVELAAETSRLERT